MSPPSQAPPGQRDVSFVSAVRGSDEDLVNKVGTYNVIGAKIHFKIYKVRVEGIRLF